MSSASVDLPDAGMPDNPTSKRESGGMLCNVVCYILKINLHITNDPTFEAVPVSIPQVVQVA
jgi:hypothetical protein